MTFTTIQKLMFTFTGSKCDFRLATVGHKQPLTYARAPSHQDRNLII